MTDRFGGNALSAGGLLFALAILLHPDISSLERASAVPAWQWAASHWAYLVGDLFVITGLVALVRRLGAGANAGWASVGCTAAVIAFVLDVATTGNHMYALPAGALATMPNAQAAFDALTAVNNGIGGAGNLFSYFGLFALGYVLWRESWSAVVSFAAMIVAAIMLLIMLAGLYAGVSAFATAPASYVFLLTPLAYAYIGWEFRRRASS